MGEAKRRGLKSDRVLQSIGKKDQAQLAFLSEIKSLLLDQVKTNPTLSKLVSEMSEDEAFFMHTSAVSTFSTIDREELAELMKNNEHNEYDVSDFFEHNRKNIIMAYQEDKMPLMTFSYNQGEL